MKRIDTTKHWGAAPAAIDFRLVVLAYSIPEVGVVLGGLSRSKVFDLLSSGQLRRTKIGRRTVVLKADLDAYLASLREVA